MVFFLDETKPNQIIRQACAKAINDGRTYEPGVVEVGFFLKNPKPLPGKP